MRTAFIKTLIEEAEKNDNIFLIVGDLGFSVVEEFIKRFPNRYLNAGIAEQNMMGVAAGLAKEGFNVFVYSIGNFPTQRCMEQIRYDVAYHNLSVKIVAVGGGFAYGSLGASHHATEEIGMLRTIPNLVITAPGDPVETKTITQWAANNRAPMYIRLGKAGEPTVHHSQIDLKIIQNAIPAKIDDQSKMAILSTGAMLDYTTKFVEENNIKCNIYSFPFIKPIDIVALKSIAENNNTIITIEEHQKSGGFGSAIIEQISDLYANEDITNFPKIIRKAIDDTFYSISGSQNYLRELSGITLDHLKK